MKKLREKERWCHRSGLSCAVSCINELCLHTLALKPVLFSFNLISINLCQTLTFFDTGKYVWGINCMDRMNNLLTVKKQLKKRHHS